MLAHRSSSLPAALTQLARADPYPLHPAEAPHLLVYLATIPDPRAVRGRRHPLVASLAMAAAAVLTGVRSMTAIAEWAADAPQPVRAALGVRRDAPDHWAVPAEATIRRTLARLDADALAAAIGAWLADRDRSDQRRRALAVDGKTLRGARRDGRQIHLLSAMEHASRAVRVPVLDRTRDRSHGRVELRILKAVTVGGFRFPDTAQVLQVTRKIRELHPAVADDDDVRGYQPHPRPGQPRPAGRPPARPLGHRGAT